MLIDTDTRMLRPVLLARAAEMGARAYRRERDLPGAKPGLLAEGEARILPTLAREEEMLEADRRARAPGYRAVRHLQVLAAYLAECRDAGVAPGTRRAQPKASVSDSLRRSTKSRRPSAMPSSSAGS